jgi:hypothetical protein
MTAIDQDSKAGAVPQAVLVTGIGRSGTSALLKSLGQHRDFVLPKAFGEAPFIDHFARFLRNYEEDDTARDYNLASYKVDAGQRYRIFSEMIFRLHAAPVETDPPRTPLYWAAKTSLRKGNYEKLRAIFGGFKAIYIIRNGIEVVNSSRHFAGFKALEFIGLCDRWKASLDSNRFLEKQQNCAVIRHEDLVEDPAATMAWVFKRIGLPQDGGPAEFIAQNIFNSSFSEQSQNGENKDVFKTRLESAWQQWSAEEREIFFEICGDAMAAYGFTVPGRSEGFKWTPPEPAGSVIDLVLAGYAPHRQPKGFTPVAMFDGDAAAAGAISIEPKAIASRKAAESADSKREIESRIGFGPANYWIHPAPSLKLLYVEDPKVASTTIKYLLQAAEQEALGEAPREFNRQLIHDRKVSPLPSIWKMSEQDYADAMHGNRYFRFTIVRNPYERLLSCYLSKVAKNMPQRAQILALRKGIPVAAAMQLDDLVSFGDFLETIAQQSVRAMDGHWRPQADQLLLGVVNYDFIGRYERLADCLGYLKAQFFPSSTVLIPGATNSTGSSSLLGQYYDRQCVDRVQSLYADDFEIFGYDRDFDSLMRTEPPARSLG